MKDHAKLHHVGLSLCLTFDKTKKGEGVGPDFEEKSVQIREKNSVTSYWGYAHLYSFGEWQV